MLQIMFASLQLVSSSKPESCKSMPHALGPNAAGAVHRAALATCLLGSTPPPLGGRLHDLRNEFAPGFCLSSSFGASAAQAAPGSDEVRASFASLAVSPVEPHLNFAKGPKDTQRTLEVKAELAQWLRVATFRLPWLMAVLGL